MMNSDTISGEQFGRAVVSLGTTLLEGYVVILLWCWFVVPIGVPRVGYWHALGITVLCALLARQNGIKRDDEGVVPEALVTTLVAWLLGWLLQFGVGR